MDSRWVNACRLCSEQKTEMLSIFGKEGLQRKVAHKLRACLPVMVYKTDPLPKQICQFCAARLDDAYEFREHCLNVYRTMHSRLHASKDLESVRIYLDAMVNSPDPCQVQLCREKARAPPPLVPLPASLPFNDRSSVQESPEMNNCIVPEPPPVLPCEVEIKEVSDEPNNFDESDDGKNAEEDIMILDGDNLNDSQGDSDDREEKRTSILEQVLTGNLSMIEAKSTSNWSCDPCNASFSSHESLTTHQRTCTQRYNCNRCSSSFNNAEELVTHEAAHVETDETGESLEHENWENWCTLCNQMLPSVKAFQDHQDMHRERDDDVIRTNQMILQRTLGDDDELQNHFADNVKSLQCPTCGKVCTQQSALSNHMRMHEPKKFKCEICGRFFGLAVRLQMHKQNEHNIAPELPPVLTSVEQEEALNEEREAREAREARTRSRKSRNFTEVFNVDDDKRDLELEAPPAKRNNTTKTSPVTKKMARCGFCMQWFNDHATMLKHLQTHSDDLSGNALPQDNSGGGKGFTCRICKKSFKEKYLLTRHEVSHRRDNSSLSFNCSTCNKAFNDAAELEVHQETHNLKSHQCNDCDKIFFKESSYVNHQCSGRSLAARKNGKSVPQNSTPKVYTCHKCNATFTNSQSKNSHMRIHSEKYIFQKQKKARNEAEQDAMPRLTPEVSPGTSSASGEPKVDAKEDSQLTMPVKRTLIRTAGGYRCGVCQSPFVLRELAVAHLRSAHPMMPYQCPICKNRFTTQFTFTHHMKTDHPNESEN